MPIRVPTVVSQQQVDLGGTPQMGVDAEQEYASAINRSINNLAQAAKDYNHVQATLKRQQDKQDAELALTEYERQATDAEINRKANATLTPEQYTEQTDADLASIRKGIASSLKSPEAQRMFMAGSETYYRREGIKGKYHSVSMRNGAVEMGLDALLRDDANKAVNAQGPTPEETTKLRTSHYATALGRIKDALATGVITAPAAAAKQLTLEEQIAEGEARRDFLDPKLSTITIARLRRGEFSPMRPDKQLELADHLELKEDAADKKRKQEIKEAEKAAGDAADKMVSQLTYGRKFSEARTILVDSQRFMEPGRVSHHLATIEAHENKEVKSDGETVKRLQPQVYSIQTDPATVLTDVNGALAAGKLSLDDHRVYAAHLETRLNKKKEGDPQLQRQHSQVEQQLGALIGVSMQGLPFVKEQAQSAYSYWLDDLSRNSAYLGYGDEVPGKWYDRNKAAIVGGLDSAARARLQQLEQGMALGNGVRYRPSEGPNASFHDRRNLEAQRGTFKTDADFWEQVRRLKEWHDTQLAIKGWQDRLKSPPVTLGQQATPAPAEAPGATPAAPKPAPQSSAPSSGRSGQTLGRRQ